MVIPPIIKNNESINKKKSNPSSIRKSYTQVSKSNISLNIENVLRIKEAFLSLSAGKVGKMMKAMNSSKGKKKSNINMIIRGPLRKQVIVPMAKSNTELIVKSVHQHIANINNCLRNIKSDVIADFLQFSNNVVIIMMSKLASPSNLSTIEKYIKNIKNIASDLIESPHLPKSKSYLKIIGLPHSMNNGIITSDFVEGVLKKTYLFKDISLTSKP